jgi:hypothetical protein
MEKNIYKVLLPTPVCPPNTVKEVKEVDAETPEEGLSQSSEEESFK